MQLILAQVYQIVAQSMMMKSNCLKKKKEKNRFPFHLDFNIVLE